jgi:ferrous iron transport protein A
MSQQPLTSPQPPRPGEHEPQLDSATERLDRIELGRVVRVVAIEEDVEGRAIARRLDDLGLRPGAVVRVLRRAPLGDPTVFELHGYQLCLRRSESARVRVVPAPASATDPRGPARA